MSDQERIAELEAQLSSLTDDFEGALNTIAELTAGMTTEGQTLAQLVEARKQVNELTEQLRRQGQAFNEQLIQVTEGMVNALTECSETIAMQANTIKAQSALIKKYEVLLDSQPAPPDVRRFRDNRKH